MPQANQTGFLTFRRFIVALLLLVMLFGVGMLFVLGRQVLYELDILKSASTDNVQWNLSQLEVDLLVFNVALVSTHHSEDEENSLKEVRRRFDALYSRVNALLKGKIYIELSNEDEITGALRQMEVFLEETAVVIDGPDDQLLRSADDISDRVSELRLQARTIAINGIDIFAQQSTEQRTFLSNLLLRVSLLAGAMIIAMAGSLFVLFRQFAITEREGVRRLQSNARLKSTVGASLDAVIVADSNGRVIDYNDAAVDIFGYSQQEAMGQILADLIIPARYRNAYILEMERFLKTGEKTVLDSGLVQVAAVRKSGQEFPVEVSIASAVGPQGTIFVSFVRDISERLEAQSELMAARDEALAADKAKSNFIAVMSHEMRTPLNGIMGTLDLMGSTPMTPTQAKYISVATKSGNLLLRHINDVLDITKAESGMLELSQDVFSPDAIAEEVVSTNTVLAQGRGNSLLVNSHLKSGTLTKGDSFRLRQILVNFVGNAIKFTSNGTIKIEIAMKEHKGDQTVEFQVVDDGIGISDENLGRVFDDFVTLDASYGRQAGGTGLGLGICRRMAEAIGGTIGVKSELGVGSTFWLRVPFNEPTEDEIQSSMSDEPVSELSEDALDELLVLVVEDNQINRFVVRSTLENMGHTVAEATDGLEGVHMANQTAFDVILMDVSMPVMDGVTATKKIREASGKSSDAIIIGLTAHALASEQERFLEAGMDLCLTKPVTSAKLQSVLVQVIKDRNNKEQAPDLLVSRRDDDPQVLDLLVLDDIRTLLGPEKFETVFRQFVTEITDSLPQFVTPDNETEFEQFRLLSHKLSGSAATFGATALGKGLLEIEGASQTSDAQAFVELQPSLKRIWLETLREYEKITGLNI